MTEGNAAAKYCAKQGRRQAMRRSRGGTLGAMVVLIGGAMTLAGCISVSAPDKPIVIELNINIKQEVVYKLDKGVGNMIEQNEGIF